MDYPAPLVKLTNGEIDLSNAESLETQINSAIANARDVVIDLTPVDGRLSDLSELRGQAQFTVAPGQDPATARGLLSERCLLACEQLHQLCSDRSFERVR